MAITKQKKEAIIDKLQNIIKEAKTIVFVHFGNVSAEETESIRSACAEGSVGYTVAKKTLINRAFDGSGVSGEMPTLDGEIALAYGEDMTAAARIIHEQGKKLEGNLTIVGGVFDNEFTSQERMQMIANIPDTKTLYAQFLMVIRAPVSGLASVLSQVAEKKT